MTPITCPHCSGTLNIGAVLKTPRRRGTFRCPHCTGILNIGALLGARTSRAKAKAARANGRRGGRPRKPTRHSVGILQVGSLMDIKASSLRDIEWGPLVDEGRPRKEKGKQ